MSYTALYRKYRPKSFEDVKGQEHIVTTIKNQIKADRIGHAYLFCGTRGTGKTTIAKIFAKAVNCEYPVDGSPCGTCPICQSIAAGSSLNVVEIDAASNNGVDNIREIREEVTYAPTEGRYKVYIIDEVHMLSIGAFNALLKTLEEPPSYVIFILATTEAHKIPITILSRCQRYDFHRISADIISERLKELIEQEQMQAEEKALRYIAKSADGAMRDALSLLDQCMAFYMGETLTYDQVLSVLGAVDTERFSMLFRAIVNKDILDAMRQIEELVTEGRELGQFVIDFTWYLRNLLLLQSSADMTEVLDVSSESLELLKEECKMANDIELMRDIRIFSELSNQVKYAAQKRVLIEIAVIKMCRPQMEEDYASLSIRIEQLEKQIEEGAVANTVPQVQPAIAVNKTDADPQHKPQLPKAIPQDLRQIVQNWQTIAASMPGIIRTYIRKARLSMGNEEQLLIVMDDPIGAEMLAQEEYLQEIKEIISGYIGKEVSIEIRVNETKETSNDTYVDLAEVIHMNIEFEE